MPDANPNEVTGLLKNARKGDQSAKEQLFNQVYDELRNLAARQLRRTPQQMSWQPTMLVNEAYIRLLDPGNLDVEDRSHFFGIAVTVMRRVLVDHYRRQTAEKRGGGRVQVTLQDDAVTPEQDLDVMSLDEALDRLSQMDERRSRVVELRFFGGLNMDEVADVLGVSKRTVESDWYFARAWLKAELEKGDD